MDKFSLAPWSHNKWAVTGPTAAAGFIAEQAIIQAHPDVFIRVVGQQQFLGNNQIAIALGMSVEEAAANARVIAAAPCLLDALRELVADLIERHDMTSPSTNPGIKHCVEQARIAIDKATGGSDVPR